MRRTYATTRRYNEEERRSHAFLKQEGQKNIFWVLPTTYVSTRSPPAYPMLVYVTLAQGVLGIFIYFWVDVTYIVLF